MKSFLKLALKYWFYNQLFFIAVIIGSFFLLAIPASCLPQFFKNLKINLPPNIEFYLITGIFLFFLYFYLKFLHNLFKPYWQKTISNFNENIKLLLIVASVPLTLGFLIFSLIFYLQNASISADYNLLAIIHLSFIYIAFTKTAGLEFFIILFLGSNIIPLAFLFHYTYKIKNISFSLKKFSACLLSILALCCFSIYYTFDNSNIVRSHNFAYENGLSSVDLSKYKITNPNNILPKLNEPSTLLLTQDEWLILDGAEATYPVYSAFANTCYDGIQKYQYDTDNTPSTKRSELNNEFRKYVAFNNTVYAFKDLINKRCDVFFGAMPSQKQRKEAAAISEELVLTPIANEAFVFFTSSDNPVKSLTTQQVRDIYSGKVKNWQPLGGEDRRILAFQRPEGSGSQTLLQHIMDDTPIMEPLKTEYIPSMGGIGESVAEYNGDAGALGFSFKFFLTGMLGRKDAPVKILAIDGVYPTDENIRSGQYPFTTKLYAITLKSNTKPQLTHFLSWMQSPQGQELAERVGYVRLN